MSTRELLSWDETGLARKAPHTFIGDLFVTPGDALVWTHAVWTKDGTSAVTTVCGLAVTSRLGGPFATTPLTIRCPKCAKNLGDPHISW